LENNFGKIKVLFLALAGGTSFRLLLDELPAQVGLIRKKMKKGELVR